MPYKKKEDKAAQMRRYRARQKRKQAETKRLLKVLQKQFPEVLRKVKVNSSG